MRTFVHSTTDIVVFDLVWFHVILYSIPYFNLCSVFKEWGYQSSRALVLIVHHTLLTIIMDSTTTTLSTSVSPCLCGGGILLTCRNLSCRWIKAKIDPPVPIFLSKMPTWTQFPLTPSKRPKPSLVERESWVNFPVDKRTWKAWGKRFLAAYQAAKRMHKANNAHGVSFGSANASIQQQNPPPYVLPTVKSNMENISAVSMTSRSTLNALLVSNACLSVTTKTQHAKIESLRTENSTLRASGNSGGGGRKHRIFIDWSGKVTDHCAQ